MSSNPQSIFLRIQYPEEIGLLCDDSLDQFLKSLQQVSEGLSTLWTSHSVLSTQCTLLLFGIGYIESYSDLCGVLLLVYKYQIVTPSVPNPHSYILWVTCSPHSISFTLPPSPFPPPPPTSPSSTSLPAHHMPSLLMNFLFSLSSLSHSSTTPAHSSLWWPPLCPKMYPLCTLNEPQHTFQEDQVWQQQYLHWDVETRGHGLCYVYSVGEYHTVMLWIFVFPGWLSV